MNNVSLAARLNGSLRQGEALGHLSIGAAEGGSDDIKATAIRSHDVCFHCLEEVPKYTNLTAVIASKAQAMCCVGCKTAAEFIESRGLSRFYDHRSRLSQQEFFGEVARTLVESNPERISQWLYLDDEKTRGAYLSVSKAGEIRLRVAVDGLYCRSCGWLIERAIKSVSQNVVVQIDIAARSLNLRISDPSVKISALIDTVEHLGYRPRVSKIGESEQEYQLQRESYLHAMRRIVVAGFGMMQVMTYAVASYFAEASDVGMTLQYERFLLLVGMLVATVVVFYSGRPFFTNALNDLKNKHLGMDVPIAIAIAAAYFPSALFVLMDMAAPVYFDSAVMFVFFLSIGRFVEARARHRFSGVGDNIQDFLPRIVRVERVIDDEKKKLEIAPNEVECGDMARVAGGDFIPFDARVSEGRGEVDEAIVSGEADPKTVSAGDIVYAGSQLLNGSITMLAINDWASSSVAKIQNSLDDAQQLEQQERALSDGVSRYFVGSILVLTVAVTLFWCWFEPSRAFDVALAMLIAACPCAFSLATPLGRTAAIGELKKAGVLLSSNRALKVLTNTPLWCFDKTGTLTRGQPSVSAVDVFAEVNEMGCLELIAAMEKDCSHILASPFRGISSKTVVQQSEEIIACGIIAQIAGDRYCLGKPSWVISQPNFDLQCSVNKRAVEEAQHSLPRMMLTRAGQVLALIYIRDEVRNSSLLLLNKLREANHQLAVLSGDSAANVESVCSELGIQQYQAECLPEEKLQWIRSVQRTGQSVVMVGDGINDSPVLAGADVAIALASGSDLALQHADVILLNGRLDQLSLVSEMAIKSKTITKQNLGWAMFYNALALPFAAFGLLMPWMAALGMSLSSLLVVLNAGRIRATKLV